MLAQGCEWPYSIVSKHLFSQHEIQYCIVLAMSLLRVGQRRDLKRENSETTLYRYSFDACLRSLGEKFFHTFHTFDCLCCQFFICERGGQTAHLHFFDRDQASSRTIILYCLYVHLIPVSQGLIQGLISNIPESLLSYVLVLLQLPGGGCILVFDSEEAWISLMALIFMESCKPSSCFFATFALWTVNITRYALPYVSEAVASLYIFILSHATARLNFGFLLAYRLVGSKLANQLYRDGKPIYLRPIDNFLTRALIRTR